MEEIQNTAVTDIDSSREENKIKITIYNVGCVFDVGCDLNLREIALNGSNVIYHREKGVVSMKIRKPCSTASISSTGKIICRGTTSEEEARIASRRFARILQKLGFKTQFKNFRVVNVFGLCVLPFKINIMSILEHYREHSVYEPKLCPGLAIKLEAPKATLKIFHSGKIIVVGSTEADVKKAAEIIHPLVYEFRSKSSKEIQNIVE